MSKKVAFAAWLGVNYGSTLQSLGLFNAIKRLGYDCDIIGHGEFINEKAKVPYPARLPENKKEDSDFMKATFHNFIVKHFQFNGSLRRIPADAKMHTKQQIFLMRYSAFINGSDQIWKPEGFWFHAKRYLQFAPEGKRIAYAPSVGWNKIPLSAVGNIPQWKTWLSSIPYRSCREASGAAIVEKLVGKPVPTVIDPSFLLRPEEWRAVFNNEGVVSKEIEGILATGKPYMVAYLLDHYELYKDYVEKLANRLGLEIIWLTGRGDVGPIQRNCAMTDPGGFVKLIDGASFVCADGFHGCCFSLNFSKPFALLGVHKENNYDSRMQDLFTRFGVTGRFVFPEDDPYVLNVELDYLPIQKKIEEERQNSFKFLEEALEGASRGSGMFPILYDKLKTKTKKTIERAHRKIRNIKTRKIDKNQEEVNLLHKNPDFIKVRYLVSLLRDHGIRHVVLSPGGRDVPIVRMFEYNEEYFTLHSVTDERSAAYFGMGIAAQLKEPVACVCTSGTAASNYLPAVTEAYYTGIPLIVITVDRYEIYHEHGEDQTIPQKDIYKGVVKKAINLPEGSGWRVEYQIKRDIQDCILESVHHEYGPVHINVGIDNVAVGSSVAREHWKLLPKSLSLLQRVTSLDGEAKMHWYLSELKKSKRILLVYGQNFVPTPEQKKNIEAFASKFNCVIVTDLISNLSCSYNVQPYNMLRAISGQEFNDKLSPDILITVGGKRLMNDPLTFKVRSGLGNIRHWSVTPSGRVKDFYFRLTSILEMSQDYFFEWFTKNAGDITNNGEYFEQWNTLIEMYSYPAIKAFDSHYIQSRFIPQIPEKSILHLGVGLSFYDTRRYRMQDNIAVFCNMGTNGIDGCTSTFMGQCAVTKDKLCFLLVGDLSFFYDMNAIWNKTPAENVRILMVNNNGSGLLRGNNLKAVTAAHGTKAEGWVKSTGFTYLCANSQEEFEELLPRFISSEEKAPLFFEIFCQ